VKVLSDAGSVCCVASTLTELGKGQLRTAFSEKLRRQVADPVISLPHHLCACGRCVEIEEPRGQGMETAFYTVEDANYLWPRI